MKDSESSEPSVFIIPDDLSEIKLSVEEVGTLSQYVGKAGIDLERAIESALNQPLKGALCHLPDAIQSLDTKDPLVLGYGLGQFLIRKCNGKSPSVESPGFWSKLFASSPDYVQIAKTFESDTRYQLSLQASFQKQFGIVQKRVTENVEHLFSDDSNVDYLPLWLPVHNSGYRSFLIRNIGEGTVQKLDSIENDWDTFYKDAMNRFKTSNGSKEEWNASLRGASTTKGLAFLNDRMKEWEDVLRIGLEHTIPSKSASEVYISLACAIKSMYGLELKQGRLEDYVSQFGNFLKEGDIKIPAETVQLKKGMWVQMFTGELEKIDVVHGKDSVEMVSSSTRWSPKNFRVVIAVKDLAAPYESIEKFAIALIDTQYLRARTSSPSLQEISRYHPNPAQEIAFMTDYRTLLMERFADLHK